MTVPPSGRESLERVANAARWYVTCRHDGARTDCAWFEFAKSAVAAHFGEEDGDYLAPARPTDDRGSDG